MVSGEKQIFKCFGCGEGGDIFSFVMKMENLEFPEALRMLAERAGVQLKRRTFKPEEGRDRKTQLYKINDLSAKVFHKVLVDHRTGKSALEYLKKRGITLETIKDFQIGYAPAFAKATVGKPTFLTKFFIQRGFTENEIQEAGAPNRFFKRIMFPIRDAMGNCIAFTGRATQEGQEPKYLNTADTILFHKGRILYNLNQAKGAIKQENTSIVVEGQMDVVASWQAGIKNVVASSGIALTDEHLHILYRYSPNIIFSFDSDSAGLKTAKKAYELAITEGFNVKMVSLGEFKDPGEMIAQSVELWQKAVKNAKPVIDWYFELAFGKQLTADGGNKELTSQEKKEIAKEILPIIKIIPDTIEQAHYVNLLAKRLGVSENVVFDALSRVGLPKDSPKSTSKTVLKQNSLEEIILAILLYRPELITKYQGKIKLNNFKDDKIKEVYTSLEKEYNKNNQGVTLRLKKGVSRETNLLVDNLLLDAEKLYKNDPGSLQEDLDQAINHINSDKKEELKQYYAKEIQKAEQKGDRQSLKKLIKEFQAEISKS